jgi:predicted DNA-binding transcriptional regulator AlpA
MDSENLGSTKGGQELPFLVRNWKSLPDDLLVDAKTVATMLGLSVPSVWRHAQEGRLPQPKKSDGRHSRWPVGVIRSVLSGGGK